VQGLALVVRLRILGEIESGQRQVDIGLKTSQPLRVDLVVQNRVPRGPLFHELGEYAGFVGLMPLVRERLEQPVAKGASGPEGDHRALVFCDRRVRDRVAGLGPRIQDPQVLDRVACEFGERGHGLGLRAPLAHDQFAVPVIQRLVLAQVEEGPGPQHRRGQAPEVVFVKGRDQQRALSGDARHGVEALLAQASRSIRHSLILRLP
jgi:hypothetical protein